MKKTLIILLLSLFILSFVANAQVKKGTISGSVTDGSAKAVESATITLLNAPDSSLLKMGLADKTGNYHFDGIPAGKYIVSVSAAGYQKGFSQTFEISTANPSLALKAIELTVQSKSIAGVTIVSKKPLIEQKTGRTVINVEASLTNAGSSALEVLEKSPGVSVDKDGNISLKGKQGVLIYVDGRPSYLSGPDLANMLRNMNASQLDQVEIMTNPSSKYDAAGNSGIINLKTKKNKQFGYNGTLTSGYSQGRYARLNEGLNFNYRNGKINFFTNLNYSRHHSTEDMDIRRNFRDTSEGNISSIFDQHAKMSNENHFYSGKIGLDYLVSKKTTVGVAINGFYNPSTWQANTRTDIYEADGNLMNQAKTDTRNTEKWKNFSSNFNFRTVLDSAGQELSGDFDFIRYCSASVQPLYSHYFDKSGNPSQTPDTLLGDLPQDIKIYSGKIDYSLPLKKGAKFEAGIKSSYVTTGNNAVYHTLSGSQPILDSGHSSSFIYEENINAAYVNYSRPLGKKWNTQIGLRLEHAASNGYSTGYEFDGEKNEFVNTTKTFSRKNTQLFPTMFLQYAANTNNQFVINYAKRVNRPDYKDLNPFIYFLDKYTFSQGNPSLESQFSHNIEFSHIYKGFLTTMLNYTATTDIIQQVLEQNDVTNETFIKKANIASLKQIGLSVSAYKEITKWWSGNIFVNLYNNHFNGVANNEPVAMSITTVLLQAQQQFKVGKGWGAELGGFYRTKGVEGVIFIEPVAQLNAGFSKQVLKNKGSIRLNVQDIFAMGTTKGYSKYGTVDMRFKNVNESRVVNMSFTWRFNKGRENNADQRKRGGANDEQNRVKKS